MSSSLLHLLFAILCCSSTLASVATEWPSALFAVLRPFNESHRIAHVPDLARIPSFASIEWQCAGEGFSCVLSQDGVAHVSRRNATEAPNTPSSLLQATLTATAPDDAAAQVAPLLYFLDYSGDTILSPWSTSPGSLSAMPQLAFFPAQGGPEQQYHLSDTTGTFPHSRRSTSPAPGAVTFLSPVSRRLLISETATPGTVLSQVIASSNAGSHIFYSIDFGTGFAIDSTGTLSLATSIAGLNKSVPLRVVVRAADAPGVIANASFMELIASIEDLNFPYFVDAQSVRTNALAVSLPRDSSVGTSAVLVAFDDDQLNPSLLQYSLSCTSSTSLALSSAGTLSVAQTIAEVERITDCHIFVADSSNPSRNSTTQLIFLPTSMYVRASFGLCGVTAVSNLAAVQAAVSTALSFPVHIITANPQSSPPMTCNGYNIQIQAYCYTQAGCSTISGSFSASPTTSAFWVSAGLPTTSSVAPLVSSSILQPASPTPPFQRAPTLVNASVYQDFSQPVPAAVLAAAAGVDVDGSALSIAVTAVDATPSSSGTWMVQTANGSLHQISAAVNVTYSVLLLASDKILFQRNGSFHGPVSFLFKLHKDTANASMTRADTSSFTSYGAFSALAVTAVGIVFPPPLTAPASNAASFSLPPLRIRFGAAATLGSKIINFITGSLVIDAPISSSLPGTPANILALLPASEQTRYTTAVNRFNTVSRRRAILLASRGTIGLAVSGFDAAQGGWQFSLTADHRYWRDLSALGPLSPSKALLLSHDSFLRFVPTSNFSGVATLAVQLWDGSDGIAGTLANTDFFPGSFSSNNLTILQSVARQNTRPEVFISHFFLPTISYTYLETSQFITVFTVNETINAFAARASQFVNFISVLVSTRTQQIYLRENNLR
jgi:hypothetical protein